MPFLIIIPIAVIILIITIPAYVAYRMAFFNDPARLTDEFYGMEGEEYAPHIDRIRSQIKKLGALEYEDIYIKADDGTTLHAIYREQSPGAPLMIECHGYKGSPFRDFSEGADFTISQGYNLLLIDQRAHGKSGGKAISFGAKEKFDCESWVKYAKERFGEGVRIVLNGISMGAATVLLAGALPECRNVLGIVADCPYSSAKDILKLEIERRGLPSALVYPFATIGARIFGGFDISSADVCAAIPAIPDIPILLIHGEADSFVPSYMSEAIKECDVRGIVEYHSFPGAAHGYSFFTDTERYKSLLSEFFSRILGKEREDKTEP